MKLTLTMTRKLAALQAEVEALRRDATHDALTGLGNRRLLEERTTGRGGFFVAIDLNGFKRAQDRHPKGHLYGDDVLRNFARFLLNQAMPGDRVAVRTGGDEFVVWCPTIKSAHLTRNAIHDWQFDQVTASAGIGWDKEMADKSLYREKEARKPLLVRVFRTLTRKSA